jgi:ABC-type transport system involved in cytochrome c biogenesis permease subunit
MDLDIPVNTATIICIIIWSGLYWLTYHYYFPAYENIEQKFQKDSMLSKIVFGMFAIAVICISIHQLLAIRALSNKMEKPMIIII